MVAAVSHVQPQVTLRRRRSLPVEGTVLVNLGDNVHSADVVARANLGSRHLILDAGRALGMSPNRAKKLIQRSEGEAVDEGAIIAGRRGVGLRQLRAPSAGTIAAISEAQVLLRVSDESSLLAARVPGTIIDVEPNRSVVIECICAWLQGVWGNGALADGFLQMVAPSPEQVLTADQIDMSLRGAILVAGRCEQHQALELAAQVPIRGLVLGSLATRLVPIAQKVTYPIVITEGFGPTAMNADAFKLLSMHNGEAATLNAQQAGGVSGDRPEVIIPLKEVGHPPQPVPFQNFRVGVTVRVVSGPHKGRLGEIATLPPASAKFPSGLRALGAEVVLQGARRETIPLANLELLG